MIGPGAGEHKLFTYRVRQVNFPHQTHGESMPKGVGEPLWACLHHVVRPDIGCSMDELGVEGSDAVVIPDNGRWVQQRTDCLLPIILGGSVENDMLGESVKPVARGNMVFELRLAHAPGKEEDEVCATTATATATAAATAAATTATGGGGGGHCNMSRTEITAIKVLTFFKFYMVILNILGLFSCNLIY